MIQEKLKEIGYPVSSICLGEFDLIGEYTAKKNRTRDSELFNSVGCFFRPNYERGILMYYLTQKYNFKSILELGFGRGYATLCMAKAMCDNNIDGKIITVDPDFNQEHMSNIFKIFPKEYFEKIDFINTTSDDFFDQNKREFDFVYIDGDHRYEGVKRDWENSKKVCNKYVLFDDYCERDQQDIECAKLINEIKDFEKELILMDRRIFTDDRKISDEKIDYGQVLIEM